MSCFGSKAGQMFKIQLKGISTCQNRGLSTVDKSNRIGEACKKEPKNDYSAVNHHSAVLF